MHGELVTHHDWAVLLMMTCACCPAHDDSHLQERAAKEKVVLPYEHQGQSSIYQAADFREYLPPAAGGHGAAAGGSGENRLGHILYVRDSDEEHDSDEDPDDDLDI